MALIGGATHVIQWLVQRVANPRGGANPIKPVVVRIAVCNFCVKSESLVIVDQNVTVNTFPGLVHTARHTMGAGSARSSYPNRKEGDYHGRVRDWGEVVTR